MIPTLPITTAELGRLVAYEWGRIADEMRVDPRALHLVARGEGEVAVVASELSPAREAKAVTRVLEELQDRYLVVDFDARRVLGWASVERGGQMVRLFTLPDGDLARARWANAAFLARVQRAISARRDDGPERPALWQGLRGGR